jgi:hypothetical protein
VLVSEAGHENWPDVEPALRTVRFDRKPNTRVKFYELVASCLQMFPIKGLTEFESRLVYLLLSAKGDPEIDINEEFWEKGAQRIWEIATEIFEEAPVDQPEDTAETMDVEVP